MLFDLSAVFSRQQGAFFLRNHLPPSADSPKFFDFTFLGMNMPCGGSLIVVGFGLSLFAYKNIKNK
jgi:hypothetical protein